jgi:NarL family two-component system response regulator LiaR
MNKIKIMIIDDDHYVREALEMLFSRSPKTTVTLIASTPTESIDDLKNCAIENIPDVILLDCKFENTNEMGVNFIEAIKAARPESKILMSSMNRDEELILEAISNGADGYVWKNESGDGIITAIERINQGRFVITKSIAEKIIGKTTEMRDYTIEILPDEKGFQKLTEELRKTMYLYCFCGMSSKEIAKELCISVHTVNSRIKSAYQTLRATNRIEAFNKLVNK